MDDKQKNVKLYNLYNDLKNQKIFEENLLDIYYYEFEENINQLLKLKKEFYEYLKHKIKMSLIEKYSDKVYSNSEFLKINEKVEKSFSEQYYNPICDFVCENIEKETALKIPIEKSERFARLSNFKNKSKSPLRISFFQNKISFKNHENFIKHCNNTPDVAKHTCKNELKVYKLDLNNFDYEILFCLTCYEVYFSSFVKLYCEYCQENYITTDLKSDAIFNASKIWEKSKRPSSSNTNFEIYTFLTFQTYHICNQYFYEPIECRECSGNNKLIYNTQDKSILCKGCPNLILKDENNNLCESLYDICLFCKEEFQGKLKLYNAQEKREIELIVKNILLNNVAAKPHSNSEIYNCCPNLLEKNNFEFIHSRKCRGKLYSGDFNGQEIVICSECKGVWNYDKINWICPNCYKSEKILYSKSNTIKSDSTSSETTNKANEESYENEIQGRNKNYTTLNKSIPEELNSEFENSQVSKSIYVKKQYKKTNNRYSKVNDKQEEIKENKDIIIVNNDNQTVSSNSEIKSPNSNINIIQNKTENKPIMKIDKLLEKISVEEIRARNISQYQKIQKIGGLDNLLNGSRLPNKPIMRTIKKEGLNDLSSPNIQFNNKNNSTFEKNNKIGRLNSTQINFEKQEGNITEMNGVKKSLIVRNIDDDANDNSKANISSNLSKENKGELPIPDNIEENTKNLALSLKNKINNDACAFALKSILQKNNILNMNKSQNGDSSLGNNRKDSNKIKISIDESKDKEKESDPSDSSDIKKSYQKRNFMPRMSEIRINAALGEFDYEDYKIISKIGEGSYGQIYHVEDSLQRSYCMKKLVSSDLKDLNLCAQEYEIVNKIRHDNVLRIYSICRRKLDNTTYVLYILMEKAITDWDREIRVRAVQKKFYSEDDLLIILKQCVDALAFLQENNISHRDIKPQNILLFKDGIFKLADFGEAKKIKNQMNKELNTLRGTELYMSPLLFEGLSRNFSDIKHNSYKSDVFSLGYCFLFAATLNMNHLYDLRKVIDSNMMNSKIKRVLKQMYSDFFIEIIQGMLELTETKRQDFKELKKFLEKNGL